MAKVAITAGDILARTAALAGDHAGRVALTLAVIAGPPFIGELVYPAAIGFGLFIWPALLVCQYDLTATLLRARGRMTDGAWARRLWPMVGLCLVSELAIVAGFGLFVIPGVVLAVRWLLAGPILLAEEVGIGAALGRSWAETENHFGLLFPVLAVLYAPFLAMVALSLLLESPDLQSSALGAIANLLARAGMVASWIAAVAAYEASGRKSAELEKVFT